MQILVDADACPRQCLVILEQLTAQHGIELVTVASFRHELRRPGHITVDDGPDAVDWAVVSRTAAGDLVVTQDMGLAAVVLAKGAQVLDTKGWFYSRSAADMMLEERAIKARHRRAGGRSKGPAARRTSDDERFRKSVLTWIQGFQPSVDAGLEDL